MIAECPTHEALLRYLQGQLLPHESDVIEGHVQSCSLCDSKMAELASPASTLVGRMMQSAFSRLSVAHEGAVDWSADGFELLGQIDQGGMGVILRVRDLRLQRDLAVKVLRPELRSIPAARSRFLTEAAITAQLQHPGIVPVHEVGEIQDGAPYLCMKLIEGRHLGELLSARCDAGEDLPRFMNIFQKICETLAYAHAKGVVHRDIKPANVMVGPFNEVYVMDWGLAKSLSESSPQAASVGSALDETQAVAGVSHTQGPLGTYAYMPPEQMRSETARLSPRNDVFSLGAILCEILTGWPAYEGEDSEQLKAAVHNADLRRAQARIATSGADPALISLCQACLAVQPTERPADASAVAAAVAGHLNDMQERLRQVDLDRAAAEVQARERLKRRRVAAAFAISVCLLIGLSCAFSAAIFWRQQRQKTRVAQISGNVNLAINHSRMRQDEAWSQFASTEDVRLLASALKHTKNSLENTSQSLASSEFAPLPELSEQIARAIHNAEANLDQAWLAQCLQKVAIDRGRVSSEQWHFDQGGFLKEYKKILQEHNLDIHADSAENFKSTFDTLRLPLQKATIIALNDWNFASNADPHDRSELRKILALVDEPNELIRRAWESPNVSQLKDIAGATSDPAALLICARALVSLNEGREAITILQRALIKRPSDFTLNFELAALLTDNDRDREAKAHWAVSYALQPNSLGILMNYGISCKDQGSFDLALALFKRGIELEPSSGRFHSAVASVLNLKKDFANSVIACRQALDLNPRLASAHGNLGMALEGLGDLQGSVLAHQRAVELEPFDSYAHSNLGAALKQQGHLDAAVAAYRRAIEIDPNNAVAYSNLGNALRQKHDLAGALAAHKKAIELDPSYAPAYSNLGNLLHQQRNFAAAAAAYQRSIALDSTVAQVYSNLGNALSRMGDVEGAIEAHLRSIELDPSYSSAYHNLRNTLNRQDDRGRAASVFGGLAQRNPSNANAYLYLGIALRENGDLEGSIVAHQNAIKLDCRNAFAFYAFGIALAERGEVSETIWAYKKAIAIEPKYAEAYCNIANAFFDAGRFQDALHALRYGHALGSQQKEWGYPSERWIQQMEAKLLKKDIILMPSEERFWAN